MFLPLGIAAGAAAASAWALDGLALLILWAIILIRADRADLPAVAAALAEGWRRGRRN
jgi:hypothetical protein